MARVEGEPRPGDLCVILDSRGRFLAQGYYNPQSQIACRVLTLEKVPLDETFFRKRILTALKLRKDLLPPGTTGYRLINSEGDFLPGLVVDWYGRGAVCQFLTAGMERLKSLILDLLLELLDPAFLYERSDSPLRREEGLEPVKGLLHGEETPRVAFREGAATFLSLVKDGQKTGFFLDQRENRRLVGTLARGKRVLDCFCYTGGFSVCAALGGASSLTLVDVSSGALEVAREHMEMNGVETPASFVKKDVFSFLRSCGRYQLVVLDPPKFVRSKRELEGGLRGYRDINRLAMGRLEPGGFLFTFSCSQAVTRPIFLRTLQEAAREAGREVQVLATLSQAPDHPFCLHHREGEYLKGFLLRVL